MSAAGERVFVATFAGDTRGDAYSDGSQSGPGLHRCRRKSITDALTVDGIVMRKAERETSGVRRYVSKKVTQSGH